ncbi:MFS transporter [Candidatus Nanopelagicales bacterium]|nr:MFS transporter [Candidatus Nanopelagicales bacterium]
MSTSTSAVMDERNTPLAYAPFRRIMAARVISSAGSTMQAVAAGWLVLMISGNPMDVGILAALALAPSLIGAPIGGYLADRFCPRKLTIFFSTILIIPPAILAALAFADLLTVPLIFLLVLLGAIPGSISGPITSLVVPFTVPARLRHKAVADGSAFYNVALFVGAIAGGTLVQFIGAGWAFAFNAASYAFSALIFATARVLQKACDRAKAHQDASLRAGFSQGWRLPLVRTVAFGAGVFFVLVAPIQQLMPVLADDHGEGAMYLGVLLAAITVGGLIGNQLLRRVPHESMSRSKALVLALAVAAPATFLLGVSPGLISDLLLLVVIGVSWELIFVSGSSSLQLDVPQDIRGRIIGLFYLLVAGAAALGALAMGWFFEKVGVNPTLITVGLLTAGVAVLLGIRERVAPAARTSAQPLP